MINITVNDAMRFMNKALLQKVLFATSHTSLIYFTWDVLIGNLLNVVNPGFPLIYFIVILVTYFFGDKRNETLNQTIHLLKKCQVEGETFGRGNEIWMYFCSLVLWPFCIGLIINSVLG